MKLSLPRLVTVVLAAAVWSPAVRAASNFITPPNPPPSFIGPNSCAGGFMQAGGTPGNCTAPGCGCNPAGPPGGGPPGAGPGSGGPPGAGPGSGGPPGAAPGTGLNFGLMPQFGISGGGVNSFDSFHGNAFRTVPDLTLFGGVGQHRLAFVRFHNSEPTVLGGPFGEAGSWRHGYQWDFAAYIAPNGGYCSVTVVAPDGTSSLLAGEALYDDCFEWIGYEFTDDELVGSGPPSMLKVWSSTTELFIRTPGGLTYTFAMELSEDYPYPAALRLTQFVDQHANTYPVETETDGTVTKVTEPAGRWLEISYDAQGNVDEVSASDGRSVTYGYAEYVPYTGTTNHALISAAYGGGLQASYQYYETNYALATMRDPRLSGPAANLQYEYYSGGRLWREVSLDTEAVLAEAVTYDDAESPSDPEGLWPIVNANGQTNYIYLDHDTGVPYATVDPLGNWNWFYGYLAAGSGYLFSTTGSNTTSELVTKWQMAASQPVARTVLYPGIYGDTLLTETWTRDSYGLVLTHTDPLERVTTWTRDTNHLVTEIEHPDETIETFTYNSFAQVTEHVLRNGGTNLYYYATNGLMTASTDPLGNSTWYGYDALDRLTSRTNALGQVITYAYNDDGQVTRITYPDSTTVGYGYSTNGHRTSMTNELGKVWTWEYNELGQMIEATDPLNRATTYEYTAAQGCCGGGTGTSFAPSKIILPSGRTTVFEYDAAGRKNGEIQGWGTGDATTNHFHYDAVGRMTNRVDGLGNSWTTTYDVLGRPESVTDPLTNTTSWTYDLVGNKLTEVRPDGGTNFFAYDAMNRLIQTIDPAGNATGFGYDAMGSLTNLTDAKTNVTAWTYNLLSRQTAKTYADSSQDLYYYDAVGNLSSNVNAASQVQWFSYDARNRLTNSAWSDTNTAGKAMTYDNAGRLLTLDSGLTALTYTYDDAGQLASETQGFSGQTNRTVSYTYTDDGQRRITTYPSGTQVTNTYTGRGQLAEIHVDGPPPLASFEYDLAGRRTQKTLENGAYATYSYDNRGQLLSLDHQTTNGTFARLDYAYNAVGNRTSRIEDWGATSSTNTYSYDPIDQVTNANYGGSWSQGFNYDAMGNLTSRVATTATNSYVANHLNQYTNIDGQLLQYDAKGNLTSGAAHLTATAMDYTYDAQNRLTVAEPTSPAEGSKRLAFWYDGRNRCVKRATYTYTTNWSLTSDLFLYYDGWNLIEERNDSGAHLASYVHGPMMDEMLVRLTTNATYYYHGDALNSAVAMTGVNGTVAERYAYEAFGLPTIMDAAGNNITNTAIGIRHLFQGREWLAEVRLNDHRHRYYSPELQRWLTRDPITERGGVNLYVFGGNNLIIGADPGGLLSPSVQALLAALAIAITQAVDNMLNGCISCTTTKSGCLACCAAASVAGALAWSVGAAIIAVTCEGINPILGAACVILIGYATIDFSFDLAAKTMDCITACDDKL